MRSALTFPTSTPDTWPESCQGLTLTPTLTSACSVEHVWQSYGWGSWRWTRLLVGLGVIAAAGGWPLLTSPHAAMEEQEDDEDDEK